MKRILYYLMAVVTLALGSCSNDEVMPEQTAPGQKKMNFNITVNAQGKSVTRNVKDKWANGDKIYVFIPMHADTPKYVLMTFNNGNWITTADQDVINYLDENRTGDFVALHASYALDFSTWLPVSMEDMSVFYTPILNWSDDMQPTGINTGYMEYARYLLSSEEDSSYEVTSVSPLESTFTANITLINNYAQICIEGGASLASQGHVELSFDNYVYIPVLFGGLAVAEGNMQLGMFPGNNFLDSAPCFVEGNDLYCWVSGADTSDKINSLTLNIFDSEGKKTDIRTFKLPQPKSLVAGQAVKMSVDCFLSPSAGIDGVTVQPYYPFDEDGFDWGKDSGAFS